MAINHVNYIIVLTAAVLQIILISITVEGLSQLFLSVGAGIHSAVSKDISTSDWDVSLDRFIQALFSLNSTGFNLSLLTGLCHAWFQSYPGHS